MLDYLPASSHSVETTCAFGAIMGARPLAQRLELPWPAETATRESFFLLRRATARGHGRVEV